MNTTHTHTHTHTHQILAGKLKPNLGRFESAPDWEEILGYFRGSELQNYFTKVLEDNLKVRGGERERVCVCVRVHMCVCVHAKT